MKKLTAFAAVTMMGILTAGAAMSVFATENTTGTHKLDFDEATEAVLADAGLTNDAVTFSKKMNDFEDGIDVYEMDFLVPGETKFDYKINAGTGEIMEKEIEPWEAEDDFNYKALLDETVNYFDFNSDEAANLIASSMLKVLDETAPNADDPTFFFKTGMEYDDGMILFKAGSLIQNKMKFEFEFDARTGNLLHTEKENWKSEYDFEYADLLSEEAAEAGSETADAALDQVTAETAKAVALDDAGFAENEVRMTKCEHDFDDGFEHFEVDFVGPDGMEYNYEISAADGSILFKEAEYDD